MKNYKIIEIKKGEQRLPAGHVGNYNHNDWIAKADCWQLLTLNERGRAIDQQTFYSYDELMKEVVR